MEESKFETYNCVDAELFNSQIISTAEIYRIIPSIGNGTLSYQRTGDKITPSKVVLNMNLGFDSDDPVARDITAHVFVLRAKAVKAVRLIGNVPIRDLMDGGGSGSVLFDGTLGVTQYPVDTDNFSVVSHKKIHLQKTGGLSGSVISQNMNTCKSLSIRIKCPTLTYDNSLDPNNAGNDFPFLVIGYCYNFPDQNPDTIVGCLRVEATTLMYYKDS